MIYAELSHNPYLLKTEVKFNGKKPQINSQMENYMQKPLYEWVKKIPKIFYDEMNGYDFNLDFTGTRSDFEWIKESFEAEGVTEEMVHLFLKNEIEQAHTKSNEIDNVFKWLEDNPNRKFNYESFRIEKKNSIEVTFPYIIINGGVTEEGYPRVNIETINRADELTGTVLTNIPILFCIDRNYLETFRADLVSLIKRKDVNHSQLFFMFDMNMDKNQIIRVIQDLGVEEPNVVHSPFDNTIIKYLERFPVTDYIRTMINIMEGKIAELQRVIANENRENEVSNKEICDKVNEIDNTLIKLKKTDDLFIYRDNYYPPESFESLSNNLLNQIKRWRNKKTKITGTEEILSAAKDYEKDINRLLRCFGQEVEDLYENCKVKIKDELVEKYNMQIMDTEFIPPDNTDSPIDLEELQSIAPMLMEMREITYENSRGDLFNIFTKPSLEKNNVVEVETCYLELWRTAAVNKIIPIATEYIDMCMKSLIEYYDATAEEFHRHLTLKIAGKNDEMTSALAQMSDEDRKCKEDNNWLQDLRYKVEQIERG